MSQLPAPLETQITVGGVPITLARAPAPLVVDETLGLLLATPQLAGQVVYTATDALYETRATFTPAGDFLLMFPTNTAARPTGSAHYGGKNEKVNDLVAFRSRDRGRTWAGPSIAFDLDYNQHGFIPLIPRGGRRLYAFGTQPVWGQFDTTHGHGENAPIGFRYSDDDGHHWSEVRLIRPRNDPEFRGMSVMRMCETAAGTWLLGAHEGDWTFRPLMTRQYVLRSTDRGQTWTLLPHPRHGGWHVPSHNRMDEGRPIALGGGEVYMMFRTAAGCLWAARSLDDGLTWTPPAPTPLVHPDAPPMLTHLSDGHTLAAFHHHRFSDRSYTGLDGNKAEMMRDRSEIWVALSGDGGRTWREPRFVFANALAPNLESPWRNFQCSYLDVVADAGTLHLFVPHRWQRALHLTLPEAALPELPTNAELARLVGAQASPT